jgi:DNA-binding GntR family transcriptional regulator
VTLAKHTYRKSEEVYEGLRALLIAGRLPAQALPLQKIADAYRTSLQPVRDACVKLEADGFIAYEPQRGYWSKLFTVEDQGQVLTALVGLFETAAKIRVDRLPKEAFATLLEEVEAASSQSPEAAAQTLAEAIEALIEAIFVASRNRFLHQFGMAAVARSSLMRRLDLQDPDVAASTSRTLRRLAELGTAGRVDELAEVIAQITKGRISRLGELVEQANYNAERAQTPWSRAA